MKNTPIALLLIVALLLSGCSILGPHQTVKGSGVTASETRSVSGFNAIELAGSGDVNVSFGDSESVVLEAEDNILPLIQTQVRGSQLVIGFKPNTTITNSKPIRITIVMKSLESARLSGSGNITITGLSGGKVKFDLPGSGNITAGGEVESVNVSFNGSGNILCGDLQAQSATVNLTGSGNVTVFASQNLDVTLRGSGNVTYRGNPANVKKSVPGSGSVQAAP